MEIVLDDRMEIRLTRIAKAHGLHVAELVDIILDHALAEQGWLKTILGAAPEPTDEETT